MATINFDDWDIDFLKDVLSGHLAQQLEIIEVALNDQNVEHAQCHLPDAQIALELYRRLDKEAKESEVAAPPAPKAKAGKKASLTAAPTTEQKPMA
jgi:sRNA-binding protein